MAHLVLNGGKITLDPTPTFIKGSREEEYYWSKEIEKWIIGVTDWGISGIHYFYLTMGALSSISGQRIKPYWRDGDAAVLDFYNDCILEHKNGVWLAWRGMGKSSIGVGLIPCYNAKINTGCSQTITTISNKLLESHYKKKVMPFLRNMKKEGRIPQEIYDNDSTQIIIKDKTERNEDYEPSIIHFKQTSSDLKAVQSLEGDRTFFICLDEYFNHPYSKEVLASSEACTTEQGEKIGTILCVGSCNDINKEGVQRFKDLKSKALQDDSFLFHLTYGDTCRSGFMEDGVSDYLKAAEYVRNKSEKYRDIGDFFNYNQWRKENFLSLSDIEDSTVSINISDDMHFKINQGSRIADELNIIPCDLKLSKDTIYPYPDTNGKFWIAERPLKGHWYIGGCDPIEAQRISIKGSNFVLAIKNMTTNKYVAYYSDNSNDIQHIYNNFKKLLYYYRSERCPKGAWCMIERTRGTGIITIAKERNETHLLVRDRKHSDLFGYNRPPNTNFIQTLQDLMFNYINRYDIPFKRFYEELDTYPKEDDCDLIDAIQSAELLSSYFAKSIDEEFHPIPMKQVVVERNGNTYSEWIKGDHESKLPSWSGSVSTG